ncbi:MAG: hypothetical protein ACKOC5_10910, partial [Chloroflexota bacterium]
AALALTGGLFLAYDMLGSVSDYPFSQGWSEGNRLYESSLYFIPERYVVSGEFEGTRRSIGRFLLWGLPFLVNDAPIWLHRLWNALLSFVPHLLLGLALARRTRLDRLGRWIFAAWVMLFLNQGPIYTPLIISALLVVLFARPGWRPARLLTGAAALAAAGYFASLSRWTWLPAVPVLTVILLLDEPAGPAADAPGAPGRDAPARPTPEPGALEPGVPPARPGLRLLGFDLAWLLNVALLALAALLGGMLANPKLLQPERLSKSTALAQPLLWYRLFPSATYPEGVLPALLLAVGPLLALLAWLAFSRRWRPTWLHALACLAGGVLLLGGGLVASVKIGGGNNLHNLDLLLVMLVFVAAVALGRAGAHPPGAWPRPLQALLALLLFLPAWGVVRSAGALDLPRPGAVRKALETLQSETQAAAQTGEVLFIDQRQLLTFGYLSGIPLVSKYEKKYMMDQAMAGDADYFAGFYHDLASRRFSLIVSDKQFTQQKDSGYAFGEENNAWVKWVSEPLLCYYAPIETLYAVDIQLLAPLENPTGCPIDAPANPADAP